MPPAAYKGGFDLKIELDKTNRAFQPGGVITGRVVRCTAGVSPRATVSIRLLGRAKTKITVTRSTGQSTSRSFYRNRFNFFEPTQTREFLFDGPLHVAPGAHSYAGAESVSWPFHVAIPLHASPRAIVSAGGHPDTCFLSLQPEVVASAPLPASFATEGRHHNVKFEAYVEYQLEATLMTSGTQGKDVTAVLALQIHDPPMAHPLTDFHLQRRSIASNFTTFHLVPGMERADLSFKQKTKQVFGSSSVPMFGYAIKVDCPTAIQLGNPTPIPFLMRIVPDRIRTSEIIRDVEQIVSLHSLELVLKAHTTVVAPTTFSSQDGRDTLKHNITLPILELGRIINPPVSIEIPTDEKADLKSPISASRNGDASGSASGSGSGSAAKPFGVILPSKWQAGDETALNIGAALDFQLFSTHATALGRPIARTTVGHPVTPGFKTYCIQHMHTLKWKATIEVAGKTVKHEGEQGVTIVRPSALPSPPAPVADQNGKGIEELPSYRASAQLAGPSSSNGVNHVIGEDLPSYGESAQSGGPSSSGGSATAPVDELPSYTK